MFHEHRIAVVRCQHPAFLPDTANNRRADKYGFQIAALAGALPDKLANTELDLAAAKAKLGCGVR